MTKFLYEILKLDEKPWIKYWLATKKFASKIMLSEIFTGTNITIENSVEKKLKIFNVKGNSVQDGEPSPENEVSIKSSGANGVINEKIVNKNLFDKANTNWYRNNMDNFINILNTSTERIRTSPFQLIPGKTYKISGFPSSVTLKAIRTYNKDETRIRQLVGVTSFTLTEEEIYIYLLFGGENFDDSTNTMMANADIQIEEGSTATNYVAHQEQNFVIPYQQDMRSIGNERDLFFKNTQDSVYYDENLVENAWYEKHKIKRIILTGTENWSNEFGTNLFTVQDLLNSHPFIVGYGLCNYFRYNAIQSGMNNGLQNGEFALQKIGVSDNVRYNIFIKNTVYSTVEDFKTWVAEQYENEIPIYVDYLLENPTNLLCTSEQVEVLEAMQNAVSYEDKTYIYGLDDVQGFLEVQGYVKKGSEDNE